MTAIKRWAQRMLALTLLNAVGAGGCFNFAERVRNLDGCTPEMAGGTDDIGGTPAACIPSTNGGAPLVAACGFFVHANATSDSADGTPQNPVKTLKRAIELAKAKAGRVYVCKGTFDETVEVPAGISLFGGLNCDSPSVNDRATKCPDELGWRYESDQSRTTLTAPAGQIPLLLQGGDGTTPTRIENFDVTAQPAVSLGGSSIAAVVNGGTAEISRCTFEAADGQDGVPGDAFTLLAQGGMQGNPGGPACSATTVVGAAPVSNLCGGSESTSGSGGNGFNTGGAVGSPGVLDGVTSGGMGGSGETSSTPCTDGTAGNVGAAGTPGAGATDLGTINLIGYVGVAGAAGTAGSIGQSGGGGGGAKGGTGTGQCVDTTKAGGASGGSGGSGGCGGEGGEGGGPGGSSIAMISLNAALTLTTVTLQTGKGGKGGDGGPGQEGGPGGPPGEGGGIGTASGLRPGCKGGFGGQGGKGGHGGGGRGGHAIGLAYVGESVPAMEGVTFDKKGTPGPGGAGVDPAHDGTAGVQADAQPFP